MTRKQSNWIRVVSLLCIVFLGCLLIRAIIGEPRLLKQHYALIKPGMSKNDLIEVLGAPNAKYSDPQVLSWIQNDEQIIIYLDGMGTVRSKEYHEISIPFSWWGWLRRVLFR
jgi:hypothetical protein